MPSRPSSASKSQPNAAIAHDVPPSRSVLMIGSEAVPFSKTGGLADVLGALPLALARLGWDVTLALPRYRGTTEGVLLERASITIGGSRSDVGFYDAPMGPTDENVRVRALLIDEPTLYDREALYATPAGSYPDNPRRFALLVRAAFDFFARRQRRPTVVHAHDWQAGLAGVYLRTNFAAHPVLGGVPSVFTIHNLAYQGVFESDWLPRLDLPWTLADVGHMEFWGKISFLKGALTSADVITTVSPQYAREIQTVEFGCGLDGVLRERSADLVGVLNGIDVDRWDPSHDRFLPNAYSVGDLSGKRASKAVVFERYGRNGAPADAAALDRPLIGMISRMVDQKGLDLIEGLARELPTLGASFVVLGTGDVRYQEFWKAMAAAHPDRVLVHVGFDEGLAHLIEAGADMFLMPSRFEPCGLNQMYSLRYGTVPIVRRVGGLADTVTDAGGGSAGQAPEPGTGFVFEDYTPAGLLGALRRALQAFNDPVRWRQIQANGMAQDHSWDRSAREYVKMYERATTKGETNGGGQRTDLHGR